VIDPPTWSPDAFVPTFRGPLDPSALGQTLMHEHVFVRDDELERNLPGLGWERGAMVERAVATLSELHGLGIGTIVDLTVLGLGRDAALVREVAERVPLNIVAATGVYATGALSPYFELRGPGRLIGGGDPLVDLFVRDIEDGIGETGVRAALIKVRSEGAALSEPESRVFAAAAAAHAHTGVAITTHSVPSVRNGLAQQGFLLRQGVPAERIVIGHCGDTTELDDLRAIMDRGSTIGLDRFGMTHVLSDERRIGSAVALVREGFAERMVLSSDAAIWSHVTPPAWRAAHAPGWSMDAVPRRILPALRVQGVSEADIGRMLVTNPATLLAARA
jgi:phosphotriesterase-related protein